MEWRAVKNFEQYYSVSSTGLVKNIRTGRIIKPTIINTGYAMYRLYVNTVCTHKLGHVLVAEAFIENPEGKRTVNHIDCDKLNNCVENLEWATHSENHTHAFRNGRVNPTAFELGVNKFTTEEVRWIRNNYVKGDKQLGACPIARRFEVAPITILKLIRGTTYKSIT